MSLENILVNFIMKSRGQSLISIKNFLKLYFYGGHIVVFSILTMAWILFFSEENLGKICIYATAENFDFKIDDDFCLYDWDIISQELVLMTFLFYFSFIFSYFLLKKVAQLFVK